jgi:hypothetical protein
MRVFNGIPLLCSLLLPVGRVNSVQTLKAIAVTTEAMSVQLTMNPAMHR